MPRLIDRLVDWYEVDAQSSLEEHETNIGKLDEELRLAQMESARIHFCPVGQSTYSGHQELGYHRSANTDWQEKPRSAP